MARPSSKSGKNNGNSAAEFARVALHKLTEQGLAPTPENYAKAYSEVSGTEPPLPVTGNTFPCMELLDLIKNMLEVTAQKTGGLADDLQTGKQEIKQSIDSLSATQEKERILQLLSSVISVTSSIHSRVEDAHEDIVASRLTMEHIKSEMAETRQWLQEDTLTGAQNRRGMDIALVREVARSKRNRSRLSVAMVDIDHFKRVNDTYGHDAGDKMLAHLGTVIKSVLRETDVLVRYGGEEFLAILPESDIRGAEFVIDRLRLVVQKTPLIFEGHKIEITLSGGVAQLKPDENGHALIIRADQALYAAKQAGRNCIKVAD